MTRKKTAPPHADPTPPGTDPAQQIWLAGLGAFSQAQKQGSQALQKMLQDGLDLQRQAQHSAEQKIADATEKMSAMAQQLAQGKVPISQGKHGPWDTLEGLFEQRVVQALQRQGWPTAEQLAQLQARVETLEQALLPTTKTTLRQTKPLRKPKNG
ncbi:MAG: phasin family protein [Alphaproteobacteria bacterium]|nr:phasin family protein [Alphaproteobacteria bacterium]